MFYDVNGVGPAALKQTRRPADCCVPATRGTKRPPRETFKAERSQCVVRWVNVACVLPPSLFGEAGVRAGRDSGHPPKPPAGPRALSLQPAASLCPRPRSAPPTPRGARPASLPTRRCRCRPRSASVTCCSGTTHPEVQWVRTVAQEASRLDREKDTASKRRKSRRVRVDTPRTTVRPGLGRGRSLDPALGAQSKPELHPDIKLWSSKDTTEKNIRATDPEKNLWESGT